MLTAERLRAAYEKARAALLAERTAEGHWVGELSSSALSTATAVGALALVRRHLPDVSFPPELIARGLEWLVAHQNPDGGWGDTVRSSSNISTTMLCRAAFHIAGAAADHPDTLAKVESHLRERFGTSPEELAEAVRRRYGKDRTFAVPILTTSALAGLTPWREVPRLPFELACLPQSWYRFARLPVVSYALPALIAIGQCVHRHRPNWNPFTGPVRWLSKRRSLRVLERIQPSSGGFLEATPLTSFVVMSLAALASPFSREPAVSVPGPARSVIESGVRFIVNSVRPDGSWPIDTNLSIWVTTLSVNALASAGDLESLDKREELLGWLLAQQTKERHPYTGAEPGAWGWSDLPGSVPDCDDTPGAVLALAHLAGKETLAPRERAGEWMRGLQNRDGGFPTFCRGWGALPFDRSGADLTAHAVRALHTDHHPADGPRQNSIQRGLAYLAREQRPDGSWLPLWFGNQHAPDDLNPTYGTARVLAVYRDLGLHDSEPARGGVDFLLRIQNADGGWGGAVGTPSSVEETALAVEALLGWVEVSSTGGRAVAAGGGERFFPP